MRDTIGGRPYEIKKDGSKHIIIFYPQANNTKNPDAVLFKLTLAKDDLKKLEKILNQIILLLDNQLFLHMRMYADKIQSVITVLLCATDRFRTICFKIYKI